MGIFRQVRTLLRTRGRDTDRHVTVMGTLTRGMPGRGYSHVSSGSDGSHVWTDEVGGTVLAWPDSDGSVRVLHLWKQRERARYLLRSAQHAHMFLDTL